MYFLSFDRYCNRSCLTMMAGVGMSHKLIWEGPKLCMQQPWFPLEPGSSFGVGNPVS